jgi:hypothetical protein
MHHGHGLAVQTWTCSVDMNTHYGLGTCSMDTDMYSSIDMDSDIQHVFGNVARQYPCCMNKYGVESKSNLNFVISANS